MGVNRLVASTQPLILSTNNGTGNVAVFVAGFFNSSNNITTAGPLYIDLDNLAIGSTPAMYGANDTSAIGWVNLRQTLMEVTMPSPFECHQNRR